MKYLSLALLVVLVACERSPEIVLDFPSPNAQFSSDELSIRGRVSAINLNEVEISLSSSDGTLNALIDIDDMSWDINDFKLSGGRQTVEVNATAINSLSDARLTFEVDTSPNTLRVTGIADVAGTIYVSDARLASVVRVDRQTGIRNIVSGSGRGDGPTLSSPAYLLADDLNLLILDNALGAIMQVDTFTGDRSVVSGLGRGNGERLVKPRVFAASGDEILVADAGLNAIISIDRMTGDREVVFSKFFEEYPVILSPRGIVVDSAGFIYIADSQYRAVIRVDRQTGQYSVTSGGDFGDGPALEIPRDLRLAADGKFLLLDSGSDMIMEVDPLTGDRRQIGGGFDIPVALEVTKEDWLVADNGRGVVWQLREEEGDPVELTSVGVGEGASLGSPADVVSVKGGWLIVDRSSGELIRVDADTGNRILEARGFGNPVSLVQDQTTQQIYILDSQLNFSGVLVYEPETGLVRQIASPQTGSGSLIIAPRQLLLESKRILILETLTSRLLSLDLNSGEREIFASEEIGQGESLSGVTRFTLDKSRNLLYMLDAVRGRILELELESGFRSELLSASFGSLWQDLQYDEENDRLLILDRSGPYIYSYDLTEHSLNILSGDGVGRGDLPANAVAFHAMPESLIAVVDEGLDALFVIDLQSGDRTIVSR